MDRQPVVSTNVKSIGYDKIQKIMEVEFHTGGIYRYFDVTEQEHSALMKAESIGSHLMRNIRQKRTQRMSPPVVRADSQTKERFQRPKHWPPENF